MKKYRTYSGLLFLDILGLIFILTLGILLVYLFQGSPALFWGNFIEGKSLLGIIIDLLLLCVLLFVFSGMIVSTFLHFSYSLKIDGVKLIESGFFSSKRSLDIQLIKNVERDRYSWMDYLGNNLSKKPLVRNLLWAGNILIFIMSRIRSGGRDGLFLWHYFPTFSFNLVDGSKFILLHPINPRILSRIHEMKPDIIISSELADLLPWKLRKQFGIKLSKVEIIGSFIWHSAIIFLFLIITVMISFALYVFFLAIFMR